MTAVIIVAVVIGVVTLTVAGYVRVHASPEAQYRRELRGIRRIRRQTRAGDPNSTSIGPNSDAFYGSTQLN